jgi:hypothetical protein
MDFLDIALRLFNNCSDELGNKFETTISLATQIYE